MEETLDAAWNIPNFDLSQFRKTRTRTWNTVYYVTLAVLGGESCSEASVHTSLITRTLKCERTHYNVLYCYALCTVLLY